MEILLAFYLLLFLACLLSYARSRTWASVAGLGITAGLMHATKETFVLFAGSFLLAALLTGLFRCPPEKRVPSGHPRLSFLLHLVTALAIMALVSATLFSSFFRHPPDIPESYQTYLLYLSKAGSEEFAQPWHYYLRLIAWWKEGLVYSEAPTLLLGLFGWFHALSSREASVNNRFLRTLGAGFLLALAAFSVLSYKTPWSILPAWACWMPLAGYGASRLWHAIPPWWGRLVATLLLAWFLWFCKQRNVLLNGRYASGPNNPYAFSHTSPDLARLASRIRDWAALDSRGNNLPVKIFHPEFGWPLPWYLRDFPRLGTWNEWEGDPHAAVVIIPVEWYDGAMGRLGTGYHFEMVGLRQGHNLAVFIANPLWEKVLAARAASAARKNP
jgi:hypothetical protein